MKISRGGGELALASSRVSCMVAQILAGRPAAQGIALGFPRGARDRYNCRASFSKPGTCHAAHPRGSPHLRRRPARSGLLARSCRTKSSLGTQLTRGIRLNLPLVSAAMDTVTEQRLAITIAQEGGIGIIHKNMTIEAQAARSRARQEVRERHHPRPDHRAPGHDHPRGARAHARARTSPACRWCATARPSASSRTATCASRPSSTRRCPR